jgi:hypothetical protein
MRGDASVESDWRPGSSWHSARSVWSRQLCRCRSNGFSIFRMVSQANHQGTERLSESFPEHFE